jgi:hypothetical protein
VKTDLRLSTKVTHTHSDVFLYPSHILILNKKNHTLQFQKFSKQSHVCTNMCSIYLQNNNTPCTCSTNLFLFVHDIKKRCVDCLFCMPCINHKFLHVRTEHLYVPVKQFACRFTRSLPPGEVTMDGVCVQTPPTLKSNNLFFCE